MKSMDYPYFLVLAYVGTSFYGWQIQSNLRSVQGELWDALRKLWGDAPMPQGTGRTDAGVHAKAQGVLVWMQKEWEPYRLLAALNAHLPRDMRVRAVQEAPIGFFPRHHSVAKRYVYRIDEGMAANPFLELRRWHIYGAMPLDRDTILEAIPNMIGTHDFSSFRCRECSAQTPIRTIFDIRIESRGTELDLIFEGDKFLMHQVRIMTGTLVEVGRGKISPNQVAEILDEKNRAAAGITAPPEGLYLENVKYAPEWGITCAGEWTIDTELQSIG
jgi:tRNA pseudouridine38-40 synthase